MSSRMPKRKVKPFVRGSCVYSSLLRFIAKKKAKEEAERAQAEYERIEQLYKSVDSEYKKSDDANQTLKRDVRDREAAARVQGEQLKQFEAENAALKKELADSKMEVARLRAEADRLRSANVPQMGIAEEGGEKPASRRKRFIFC